jgi:hypothetical protein
VWQEFIDLLELVVLADWLVWGGSVRILCFLSYEVKGIVVLYGKGSRDVGYLRGVEARVE